MRDSIFRGLGALQTTTLRPRASSLIESLRDIGYSLETAISDLVDNSIAAQASQIDIWCLGDEEPLTLAVVDNGTGMSPETLVAAMRPGSADPRAQRSATDLGRFGLGLKTASFSQGRKLTVASRNSGIVSAAIWDLDKIAEDDEWTLGLPDAEEIGQLAWIDQLPGSGTLVLWEKMDRFVEALDGERRSDLVNSKLSDLAKHLSLVFHRFLSGEAHRRGKLRIRINGRPIPVFDPFCREHPATQSLPTETLAIGTSRITIQAYILPHHSKLSPATLEFYQSRGDFLSSQGAYVYRNDRLMAWGNWFGMLPKGEATKLARVAIDFPSSLDDQWTIDIKKSRAHPPPPVRHRFRQIIERIAGSSVKVFTGRAERSLSADNLPLWVRLPGRNGTMYLPNEEHPVLQHLLNTADPPTRRALARSLEILGSALPLEAIYADISSSPKAQTVRAPATRADCHQRLLELKELLDDDRSMGADTFLRVAISTRQFVGDEEMVEQLVREIYS